MSPELPHRKPPLLDQALVRFPLDVSPLLDQMLALCSCSLPTGGSLDDLEPEEDLEQEEEGIFGQSVVSQSSNILLDDCRQRVYCFLGQLPSYTCSMPCRLFHCIVWRSDLLLCLLRLPVVFMCWLPTVGCRVSEQEPVFGSCRHFRPPILI